MNTFITYFFPKDIDKENQLIQTKVKYLVFCLIGIGIACLCSITLFYLNSIHNLLFLTILMLFTNVILMVLLKLSGRITLTSYLFGTLGAIYIAAMVYYTGGVDSSFIFWVITLPIVATFIAIHVDLIYYMTVLAIGTYLIFLILSEQGFETPNLIPTDFSTTYNIVINQILIMITIVGILIFYYYQNQSYNQELKASNERLERFASVASHDLKAPLRNIISFTQLLKRKLKQENDKDILDFLGFIEKNGRQMNELIQGLLDFSKLQKDQLIEFETVNLNETIAEVKSNLKTDIENKQANIEVDHLPIIHANRLHIKQLFQNIIGNGLKYNRSEFPSVKITHQKEGKLFHFFIEDNGIGIDESYFEKVFEMFLRLNSSAEFQGTGIGLAICKKIALLHGGKLSVFKSSNSGTVFKLSLPVS